MILKIEKDWMWIVCDADHSPFLVVFHTQKEAFNHSKKLGLDITNVYKVAVAKGE